MSRFTHHIFVCTNERPDTDTRGCCKQKGSQHVVEAFKAEIHRRGLKGKVRANSSGCLDNCAQGVSVVVYPEAVWYGGVQVSDVVEIVEKHIVGGEPVERLQLYRDKARGKELPGFGFA
ncbi:(2Fe-2S) ferredoxin domain-containing protein [bacterium]|nr:(2Fe-2S) ferredoxin domain-containing protein [bacterium]